MLEEAIADNALLELLTPKEREVLDLVADRHTTKEIARQLGLSPNAVDARVAKARDKLRARDRNDTVRIYTDALRNCGKTTSGPTPMADGRPAALAAASEPPGGRFTLRDAGGFSEPAPWEVFPRPRLSEVLDERFGLVWRVAAIPFGALGIALLALALIAIAQVLSMLI